MLREGLLNREALSISIQCIDWFTLQNGDYDLLIDFRVDTTSSTSLKIDWIKMMQ